jgi:P27 family predicted phage terminase small subunit
LEGIVRPGPAPKPTAIKELAGNPGKRPLNEREPSVPVPSSSPYAPRHLCKEGQKEWRRVVGILIDAGLYSEVDRAALAMYCQAWGRWVEAEKRLGETGGPILASAETGNLYQNPWLHVANKALGQIRQMIAEFGLSPAQRSRVAAMAPEREPSLAEILRGEFKVTRGGKGG